MFWSQREVRHKLNGHPVHFQCDSTDSTYNGSFQITLFAPLPGLFSFIPCLTYRRAERGEPWRSTETQGGHWVPRILGPDSIRKKSWRKCWKESWRTWLEDISSWWMSPFQIRLLSGFFPNWIRPQIFLYKSCLVHILSKTRLALILRLPCGNPLTYSADGDDRNVAHTYAAHGVFMSPRLPNPQPFGRFGGVLRITPKSSRMQCKTWISAVVTLREVRKKHYQYSV